jgi:hypothetical protein
LGESGSGFPILTAGGNVCIERFMFGLVKVNDPLLGAAVKDLEMN